MAFTHRTASELEHVVKRLLEILCNLFCDSSRSSRSLKAHSIAARHNRDSFPTSNHRFRPDTKAREYESPGRISIRIWSRDARMRGRAKSAGMIRRILSRDPSLESASAPICDPRNWSERASERIVQWLKKLTGDVTPGITYRTQRYSWTMI
jgi:hypothetical protein